MNYIVFVSFCLVPLHGDQQSVSLQYNGGLLPDIMLLTQCYYHRRTRLNYEDALPLQPMGPPPECIDIFSPLIEGCSEGPDAFRFFFKHTNTKDSLKKFLYICSTHTVFIFAVVL